jgi:deltex-like protein
MTISRTPQSCAGHEPAGSIVLIYQIPSGTQKSYHAHPGQRYAGTNRTAYVPDTPEGQGLLKRLRYAFQRGLTFTVGTSLTTGATNAVTWGSIHHKTCQSGGPRAHGFPDPSFLGNCGAELDALGVPPAAELPE